MISELKRYLIIVSNREEAMEVFRNIVLAAAVLSYGAAHSEILQGIAPLDTLGDVKHKYPNAVITAVKAAWVTEDQAFYSLSGQGFPGVIYIAFEDDRPGYRKQLAAPSAMGAASEAAQVALLAPLANQSDDAALTVMWTRWVPEQPIPMARYKAKYGQPTKCDFQTATMQPYCSWESRSLMVNLSDDQLKVLTVEAHFTDAEQRLVWKTRYGFVPPWLTATEPAKAPSSVRPAPASKNRL